MTDDNTPRLVLPLLQAGQAQKEIAHNEALARLDVLVQPAVEAVGIAAPPAAPAPGQAWIVGANAAGDWAGHDGMIAAWTAAGWRFLAAREGMSAWSSADRAVARVVGGKWHVAPPAAAVADPAGGAVIDTEARATLSAMLRALRDQGLVAG